MLRVYCCFVLSFMQLAKALSRFNEAVYLSVETYVYSSFRAPVFTKKTIIFSALEPNSSRRRNYFFTYFSFGRSCLKLKIYLQQKYWF